MFEYKARITMHDADAAGVLFFGRYFALAHDAYEAFLESKGYGVGRLMKEEPFLIPVVHAEASYKRPLWAGDLATIELTVASVRSRSFLITYTIKTPAGETACLVKTSHATVDKAISRAIPLPDEFAEALCQELDHA